MKEKYFKAPVGLQLYITNSILGNFTSYKLITAKVFQEKIKRGVLQHTVGMQMRQ